jgi:hypothetical protein
MSDGIFEFMDSQEVVAMVHTLAQQVRFGGWLKGMCSGAEGQGWDHCTQGEAWCLPTGKQRRRQGLRRNRNSNQD